MPRGVHEAGHHAARRPERGAYRDIGTPLLAYIRELTEDPDTVVNIVMPEIVVRGWARFLHNQRALYIKRLCSSSGT